MSTNKRVNFIIILILMACCLQAKETDFIYVGFEDEDRKESKENKKEIGMYNVKENIKPSKLIGISDDQISDHWKLYEGYVKNVNKLNQELELLRKEGKADSLIYADRRRRYGFEYNGMVLHEYYFENLKPGVKLSGGTLKKAIEKTWGSFENWKQDFIAAGKTRGIGWVILYCDPTTKRLTNNFVAEHQNGNIAGYEPILVMDVWEHAYMVDHNAGGRGKYIESFLQNINWDIVEKRFVLVS